MTMYDLLRCSGWRVEWLARGDGWRGGFAGEGWRVEWADAWGFAL